MEQQSGYWSRLCTAVLGRGAQQSADGGGGESVELAARFASLEMDLAERDRQIADMRIEYATLEGAK